VRLDVLRDCAESEEVLPQSSEDAAGSRAVGTATSYATVSRIRPVDWSQLASKVDEDAGTSSPMAPGILNGDISGAVAGERFLIALIGCWILGSLISWVLSTYTRQATRAELNRLVSEQGGPEIQDGDPRNASTGDRA
jgi:hypothetical protein